MALRQLKGRVRELIAAGKSDELSDLPAVGLLRALLPLTNRPEESLRLPAITALGRAAARQAARDPEPVREIFRRLIWSLNDESGSIGWGAAQAMAEIMAGNEALAREYAPLLIGLLAEDSGSPDFPPLVEGALWAVGRVAEIHPELVKDAARHLPRFLLSENPQYRALAARIVGLAGLEQFKGNLELLLVDEREVGIYIGGRVVVKKVKKWAEEGL